MRSGNPNPVDRRENLLPPSEAPLKHGVYGEPGILMRCNRCPVRQTCPDFAEGGVCKQEAQYLEDRARLIMAREEIDPVLDAPLIAGEAWAWIMVTRCYRSLAVTGVVLPGTEEGFAEPQPLLKSLPALLNSWSRLLDKMALTPAARKAMQGQVAPQNALAAAILEDSAE